MARFRRLYRAILWAALTALASVVGVELARLEVAAVPELSYARFNLNRPEPFEVTPAKPLTLPRHYGDFDLVADVELSANTELDIVVRRIDPQITAEPYHGRFSVVRLSTDAKGPALRSREDALFGVRGGHRIEPGYRATVQAKARGRQVEVTAAGVPLGAMTTTDAHGGVMLVSRGGTSLVHFMDVSPVPRPRRLLPWSAAALIGAIAGLLAGWLPLWRALALIVVPLVGWLGGKAVLGFGLPELELDVSTQLAVGLAGLPIAWLAAWRWWAGLVGLLVGLGMWEWAARDLDVREDPRMDAYFGTDSGSVAVDALAQRLTSRARVHTVAPAEDRVVFLGGGLLYETGVFEPATLGFQPDPNAPEGYTYSHARQTEHLLSSSLGRPVDCVIVPTIASHARQQLAFFQHFCVDSLRPEVVVFALAPWEFEPGLRVVEEPSASSLLSLWRRASAGELPPSDPTSLRATLDELVTTVREAGAKLVLFKPVPLPDELDGILRELAERERLTLVENRGVPVLEALVAALVDALGR